MNKSEFYISSSNGSNQLHCVEWKPEGEPRAVVQISHGMVEYVERYDRFARFLNEAGIVVVGNDHLGHGLSVNNEEEFGYFGENEPSKTVVDDLYQVTLKMKKKYEGIPYFVMGHSMGSFMIRRYIMTYGSLVDGVVIMGTGSTPVPVLLGAKSFISIVRRLKGNTYRSALCDRLCFGNYNKRIHPVRTEKDWLTKDEQIVDQYLNTPMCTFLFTTNGYHTLFSTISFIQKKENIDKIPKDLPVYLISGEDDPVGNYGRGVKKVYEIYKHKNIQDIELKLYKGDRHELVNETDYEVVYQDILSWIEKRIHNI
ncbi:MAG: alpha/beta fold hydrolase [Clostridium sp.]|nr:alpha/beta fold hydrolase [Clostridium sp.]